jgi:hypothetical protein
LIHGGEVGFGCSVLIHGGGGGGGGWEGFGLWLLGLLLLVNNNKE